MTMDATPGWALPLLFAGQAQKEIFHNEALMRVDMLLHPLAQSADEATPPGAPAVGACWIVAAGGSGAWDGRDGALACWTEGGWRFVAPRAGMTVLVADLGHALWHDGSGWIAASWREDGLYVAGDRVVGERGDAIPAPAGGAVTDAEARTAIGAMLAAMRNHGLIAT